MRVLALVSLALLLSVPLAGCSQVTSPAAEKAEEQEKVPTAEAAVETPTKVPPSVSIPLPCDTPKAPKLETLLLEVTEPEDGIVVEDRNFKVSGNTIAQAIVSVNGQLVDVDSQGHFHFTIRLEEGLNSIEVIASDEEGSEVRDIRTAIYLP